LRALAIDNELLQYSEEIMFNNICSFLDGLYYEGVEIGKIVEDKSDNGRRFFYVKGIAIGRDGSKSVLMSSNPVEVKNNIIFDIDYTFGNRFMNYLSNLKDREKGMKYKSLYNDIKEVRKVIIPFDLRSVLGIVYNGYIRGKCKIEAVKITIENGKVQSILHTNYKLDTRYNLKFNIKDYGIGFVVDEVDRANYDGIKAYNIFEMTENGVIRPIEFVCNNVKVAVDGFNIYLESDRINYIIGGLDKKVCNELSLSKVYKKFGELLEDKIEFIAQHRRLIAPYKSMKPKVVEFI